MNGARLAASLAKHYHSPSTCWSPCPKMSVNGLGALEIEVTKLSKDSTLARVVRMVSEAQAQTSPTQQFTDRFQRSITGRGVSALIDGEEIHIGKQLLFSEIDGAPLTREITETIRDKRAGGGRWPRRAGWILRGSRRQVRSRWSQRWLPGSGWRRCPGLPRGTQRQPVGWHEARPHPGTDPVSIGRH